MNKLSPIALFVYNRPEHTNKTVDALKNNTLARESSLFIFSDGPKNESSKNKVKEVREYIKKIDGFKEVVIIEREKNYGLAKSIIEGVTEIVNKFGKIIVLEDDLITSPYFLKYMNDALDFYENQEKVISIHGYVYPTKKNLPETFFIKGADCWGWATWKRGWKLFELDGKKLLSELQREKLLREFDFNSSYPYVRMLEKQIAGLNNSWAVRWYASAFLAGKLTLYPGKTLVQNIGADSSGTHCGSTNAYESEYSEKKIVVKDIPVEENKTARKEFERFFKTLRPGLFKRVRGKIKKYLKDEK